MGPISGHESLKFAHSAVDAATMPWPDVPSPIPAVAAGVHAQWTAAGEAFPPLFAVLSQSPTWLVAMLRMRAYARGQHARLTVSRIERVLCAATSCPPVVWPCGFGSRQSKRGRSPLERAKPDLARMHPSHRLVLTARSATRSVPECAVLEVGLQTAFGDTGPFRSLPISARMRALAAVIPGDHRSRWEDGLGLEPPPTALDPVSHEQAAAAMQVLASGAPVDPDDYPDLPTSELVDLIGTAAVTAVAANAAPSPTAETVSTALAA